MSDTENIENKKIKRNGFFKDVLKALKILINMRILDLKE